MTQNTIYLYTKFKLGNYLKLKNIDQNIGAEQQLLS